MALILYNCFFSIQCIYIPPSLLDPKCRSCSRPLLGSSSLISKWNDVHEHVKIFSSSARSSIMPSTHSSTVCSSALTNDSADLDTSVEGFHCAGRRSHSDGYWRRVSSFIPLLCLPVIGAGSTPLLLSGDQQQAQAHAQRNNLHGCLPDGSTRMRQSVFRHTCRWYRVSRWKACGVWTCHRGIRYAG